MDEGVQRSFKVEGVTSQEVADVIIEGIRKIKGVEDVRFQWDTGELVLDLVRQNNLILKLMTYVVAKAGEGISISEVLA